MKNITKIQSNKKKRTYTIHKNGSVYQTLKLTKEEFEHFHFYTEGDWNYFLQTSQHYYIK